MSWKDNLISASFRGEPFFISDSERSAGLITIPHSFIPEDKKDDREATAYSLTEDQGVALDEFIIEGYVLANAYNKQDYFAQRDALITALRARGPGKLNHPFYGNINVILIGQATIRESIRDGGMAIFSMVFRQYGDPPQPTRTADTNTSIDDVEEDTRNSIADAITSQLETAGNFIDAAASAIGNGMQQCISAVQRIRGAASDLVSDAISAMSSTINSIGTLMDTPCQVANALASTADQIKNVLGYGVETFSGGVLGGCSGIRRGEYETFDGTYITEPVGTSAIDAIGDLPFAYDEDNEAFIPEEQEDNVKLLFDANKLTLLGIMCSILMRIDFKSQEKAYEYLEYLKELFDEYFDRIGARDDIDNNLMYQAAEELRNSFVENFTEKVFSITKSIDYQVGYGALSALELAYIKYSDLDRIDDIFERNQPTLRHPGFLPNGDTIRILDE